VNFVFSRSYFYVRFLDCFYYICVTKYFDMDISQVRFDCKHFKGTIPCKPSKNENVDCADCPYFEPWDKHILMIKLGAMGDVIRTTPLVVRYRKLYGNVHFTWLTQFPDVLPKSDIQDIMTPDAFSLLKIKERKFDIAINLDKEEEACRLLSLVNAKEKYGYIWNNGHLDAATPAANHKIMTGLFDHISIKNTKSYLEEIFEICHLDFQKEEYLLNYNKSIAAKWKDIFAEKAQGRKIVGLNTGCGNRWLTRLWPDDYWKEFILSLNSNDILPILLGGPQEHEKNTSLANDTAAWYPGTFSLEEFISLTSNLDVVVTQVSMMMHIAVGHKTPMVLMNNIFNKHEFEMYGRGVIVEPETGCDCYFGNSCSRERSCMYDIKPLTIKNEVLKLI
jgi:ADP-heptose:LPS heptosyltransferase